MDEVLKQHEDQANSCRRTEMILQESVIRPQTKLYHEETT